MVDALCWLIHISPAENQSFRPCPHVFARCFAHFFVDCFFINVILRFLVTFCDHYYNMYYIYVGFLNRIWCFFLGGDELFTLVIAVIFWIQCWMECWIVISTVQFQGASSSSLVLTCYVICYYMHRPIVLFSGECTYVVQLRGSYRAVRFTVHLQCSIVLSVFVCAQ